MLKSCKINYVKATDLCPANQGSNPAGTYESVVVSARACGQSCSHALVNFPPWYLTTLVGTPEHLNKGVNELPSDIQHTTVLMVICQLSFTRFRADFFTGWMSYLTPKQQSQVSDGKNLKV